MGQLMDYIQGLNPLGKCYVSGIGFDRVHHPHDRESTYAQEKGVFPAAIYPVLARGGKWNPAKDPFAAQQK